MGAERRNPAGRLERTRLFNYRSLDFVAMVGLGGAPDCKNLKLRQIAPSYGELDASLSPSAENNQWTGRKSAF